MLPVIHFAPTAVQLPFEHPPFLQKHSKGLRLYVICNKQCTPLDWSADAKAASNFCARNRFTGEHVHAHGKMSVQNFELADLITSC